ncbi:hypothetical protein BP5796_06383 [Coleophoma crateriformis]|uniref:BHLH domain-containing protein n=1 Tax=Coleophoma crateriformis TaxID=565419 RepID=A0A3D8RN88_9HELO|nr:hypothetical protein BP5796_06383 [Coleophoma crateriformis]
MLVAQRNGLGMGSSKRPDEMPFGYSFGSDTSFPFPSPTGPPPGPSLLDEHDSRYLDNFFQGVDSNDINFDLFTNADDVFHDPGWQELPPTFMGTSSSFGQQPAQPPQVVASSSHESGYKAQDMTFKAQDMAFSDMNNLPSTTSPDVMAAAQTLISNGVNNRSHSMGNDALFGMTRNNSMLSTNGHGIHQPMFPTRSRSIQDVRSLPTGTYPPETYYRDMFYGGEVNQEAIAAAHDVLQPEKPKKIELRWGSDVGFGTEQGFVPPAEQETAEEVEREHIRRMKEFAHELSMTPAAESQPSSPQPKKAVAKVKVEDEDARARKRRKSKYIEEDEDEVPAPPRQSGSAKKRKSIAKVSEITPASPAVESSSKRKKSSEASSAVKPARENLTEDQKRENHIKSEQKRRTLIREGFDDLGELVPGLRGGGFSKSAVLVMAADWLEDLLKGNEILKSRIKDLERGGG